MLFALQSDKKNNKAWRKRPFYGMIGAAATEGLLAALRSVKALSAPERRGYVQ